MKLRLVGKKSEVEDVYSFILQPEQSIEWQPGQYMHYVLQHPEADDRGVERWFTISAAPFERHLMITTRFNNEHGSTFKTALGQLKEGDAIEADGPKGKFVLREGNHQHVLIAGGIGVTPYRSMLAQLAHDNKPANATLLYANRDENFVFKDELEKIQRTDNSFKMIKFVDKRIEATDLEEYLKDPRCIFYLSGPEAMVENYEQQLETLNVPQDNIMTDYFPGY